MITTLNAIRKHQPCKSGWEKLLSYLGKTKADDEPLEITTILDSNGLNDALWCLRAVEGRDREIRLYAVWCARQVQYLMKDQRSIDALDVAERYANGEATGDELDAVWSAVWAAACEAARSAAGAAARAAAMAAARTAAWYAARAAARDAAMAAARTAARSAAMDATWDAARDARDTAWVEMKRRQEAELRRICEEVEG